MVAAFNVGFSSQGKMMTKFCKTGSSPNCIADYAQNGCKNVERTLHVLSRGRIQRLHLAHSSRATFSKLTEVELDNDTVSGLVLITGGGAQAVANHILSVLDVTRAAKSLIEK